MNDFAISKDYVLKFLSITAKKIAAGRIEEENSKESHVRKVDIKHEQLFSLFEIIYPFVSSEYPDFSIDLLEELDSYDDIEEVSSVSNYRKAYPSYNYVFEDGTDFEKSDFSALENTTLIEHLISLVKIIEDEFEHGKNIAIDRVSLPVVFMLAILHDVGKIGSLCEKYSIDRKHSHEERGYRFLKLFVEEKSVGRYSETERSNVAILLESMNSLSKKEKEGSFVVQLFNQFDELSRSRELAKFIKERKKKGEI